MNLRLAFFLSLFEIHHSREFGCCLLHIFLYPVLSVFCTCYFIFHMRSSAYLMHACVHTIVITVQIGV